MPSPLHKNSGETSLTSFALWDSSTFELGLRGSHASMEADTKDAQPLVSTEQAVLPSQVRSLVIPSLQ